MRSGFLVALTLFLSGLLPLLGQEDANSVLPQAPSEARFVKTRLGGFDAVSGVGHFKMPLGPTLPGRIPAGFSWTSDGSYLNASIRPVSWRIGNASQGYASAYSNTITLFGEDLYFSTPAQPAGANMPTAAQMQGWLTTWNVTDTGKSDADAALAKLSVPVGKSVTATSETSTQVFQATTDGTKFLVYMVWTVTKSWGAALNSNAIREAQPMTVPGNTGTLTATVYHPIVFTSEAAYSIGTYLTTITNRWGDQVTIQETKAGDTSTFLIQNANIPSLGRVYLGSTGMWAMAVRL